MSSTKRGSERHGSDYYVTPIPVVERMVENLTEDFPDALEGKILDPCAGGDENTPMSYPQALVGMGVRPQQIHTVDIREDSRADTIADYRLWTPPHKFDLIITNPPFDIAQEIIEKALTEITPDGLVVMLLRVNFFGSDKRFDFFQRHMPERAYIHHKRISFTGKGQDSIEYMHAVWSATKHKETKLRVI